MSYLGLLVFFYWRREKSWFKHKHGSSPKHVLPNCCINSSGCREIVNSPSVKTSLRCLSRTRSQSIQTFFKVFLYIYRPLISLYSEQTPMSQLDAAAGIPLLYLATEEGARLCSGSPCCRVVGDESDGLSWVWPDGSSSRQLSIRFRTGL